MNAVERTSMAPRGGTPLRGRDDQQVDGAIAEWLALAQQAPGQAWSEWSDGGVALLPLGRRFVAARLPEALVYAAVKAAGSEEVAERLEQRLQGPVIFDDRTMGGTFYTLMEPRDRSEWKHQEVAPLLGRGTYLGVPKLARRKPPGTHWVVPPRFIGDLCRPEYVAVLVAHGLKQLAREREQ